MSELRIPESIQIDPPLLDSGFLFWADLDVRSWPEVAAELNAAFIGSRSAAQANESIVYIVSNDAVLGRKGAGPAMVAAGLLSGARTAALEGSRKGWTANVVAYDEDADVSTVLDQAMRLLEDGAITGELIHVGPGHIGKALA